MQMSETDRRIKDYLNTDQAKRERMCLEILATLPGYKDVKPRSPKGGRDGGRDISAFYNGELCFGAVGFVNDATDLTQHRTQIEGKFRGDLQTALHARDEFGNSPKVFVFFTNVGLTPGIIDGLKNETRNAGITSCDVLDRERIRIALDSSKGYATRFRYLDLSLSDAEQKDFFSTWAQELNSMVSSRMGDLDQSTKRIQFLLEAQMLVDSVKTVVHFDCPLGEIAGGNYIFQTDLNLYANSDGLMGYHFGGGSFPIQQTLKQWEDAGRPRASNSQYRYSFAWVIEGTQAYIQQFEDGRQPECPKKSDRPLVRTFTSSGILELDKKVLTFESGSKPFINRFYPSFPLIALDHCWILFTCTRTLAARIASIFIYANGYELLHLERSDWNVEASEADRFILPKEASDLPSETEIAVLRPKLHSSIFSIELMHNTPRRYNWVSG
jgi:hypothetical protein